MEKLVRKKTCTVAGLANHILGRLLYVQSFLSILAPKILLASDSERRPRRSSGVHVAYKDPSGERQRTPSTPRWGPTSLH